MAHTGDSKLKNLHEPSEILKHCEVAPIIHAVSQGHSLLGIKKSIKSLKKTSKKQVFQCVIRALAYTIVKVNRTDLIGLVTQKYGDVLQDDLNALLLYAVACGHCGMTESLLNAGANPLHNVNKKVMLASTPHEDLSKTMTFACAESTPCHHDDCFCSAWHVTMVRDDLVIFQLFYTHITNILQRKIANKRKMVKMRPVRLMILEDVVCHKAYSILDYCLTNKIHSFSQKSQEISQCGLSSLFEYSCQHLDILRQLYQHKVLHADMERLFSNLRYNTRLYAYQYDILQRYRSSLGKLDAHLPANQLHHAVSAGQCPFLVPYYRPGNFFTPHDYLSSQISKIICFLLENGVQADGLMMSKLSGIKTGYQLHVRPVTLVAVHISQWTLARLRRQQPCSVEDYITRIHGVLNTLPFFPHTMKPWEINPLYFSLVQTTEMIKLMDEVKRLANNMTAYSDDTFVASFEEPLMIAEDLCLYFLKQGFRFQSDYNMYTVMYHLLDELKYKYPNDDTFSSPMCTSDVHRKVRKDITDTLGSFFIRTAKVLLAYHDSAHTYISLYKLLCHSCIWHFDAQHLLKVHLDSSSETEYRQILRGFTEFVAKYNQNPQEDLLELSETLLTNPRTLIHLCRGTIFNAVKAPVFEYAEQLPLPKELILYITELE